MYMNLMSHRSSLVLLCLALPLLSYSQTPWHWQNPWPQGNDLASVWALTPGKIIATGKQGSLVTTSDAGSTWTICHIDSTDLSISLRSIQFVDSLRGWSVGGRDGTILPRFIYRTTDGGHHWSRQSTHNVEIVCVFFADEHHGWAVGGFSNGVVLKTTDGGTTWVDRSNDSLHALADVFFVDTSVGWAVGIHGFIVKTEDGGETWFSQSLQIPDVLQLLSAHFVTPSVGWVGGTAQLQGFIAKTTDGGSSWTPQLLAPSEAMFSDLIFLDEMRGWAVGGASTFSSGNVYRTTDGGDSWTSAATGSTLPLHSIHFSDTLNGWSVGDLGRILSTTDGGSAWFEQSRGPRQRIVSIAMYDTSNGIALGREGMVMRTTDGGANWTSQILDPHVQLWSLSLSSDGVGWAAGSRFGTPRNALVFKTTDRGESWDTIMVPHMEEIFSLDFVDQSTGLVLARADTGRYVLKTTDSGFSWMARPINHSAASITFLDSLHAWIAAGSRVYRSTNGGLTWNVDSMELTYPVAAVTFLTPLCGWAVGGIEIFNGGPLGGEGLIYQTTDGGQSWIERLYVIRDAFQAIAFADNLTGLAAGFTGSGHIYPARVYRTSNGGLNWHPIDIHTKNSFYGINITGRQAWVCGDGGMILRANNLDAVSSVVERSKVKMTEPLILHTYPNPFNSQTILEYTVPHAIRVTVSVYNVLGQHITTLIDDNKLPGIHTVAWNGETNTGRPLPSGVYLLRLIAGELSYTTKVILLR